MGFVRKIVVGVLGCFCSKITKVEEQNKVFDEVNHNSFRGDTVRLSNGVANSGVNVEEHYVFNESGSDTTIWNSCENSSDGRDDRDIRHGSESLKSSKIQINTLKEEVVTLSRQMDVWEMELRTLRKQISKESKMRYDMSKELTNLKRERDAFMEECEKLIKVFSRNRLDAMNMLSYEANHDVLAAEEIQQDLSYEKYMNFNLRLQLRKTQESNAQLMLVIKELEQENKELSNLSHKSRSRNDKTLVLEQKIINLSNEIEIYEQDKDDLHMQMEELAFDYETLKLKSDKQNKLLEQLHLQRRLYEGFGADLKAATAARVEQEQIRGTHAKESLRKTTENFEEIATQGITERGKRTNGRRIGKSQGRNSGLCLQFALPVIPENVYI